MSGLEIQSTGEIIASCNGNIVEDAKWNMNYDGNNMIIESMYNNDLSLIQLNNEDLQRLFSTIGSHKNGLEERLQRDLGKSKYSNVHKTKRVRFLDNSLRKTGKNKTPIVVNTLSDQIRELRSSSSKRSSKRSSAKKSSAKKSSIKHSSAKKSSPKRSSAKRSSPKRSSPKRSSTKRSSRKKKKSSGVMRRTKRKSIENTIY